MWQLDSSIPSENWKGSIIWKRRKFYFVSEIPTQWTCTVVGVSSFKLSTSHSCVEDANVINCTTATLMDGLKSGAAWVHRPARVATYIQHKNKRVRWQYRTLRQNPHHKASWSFCSPMSSTREEMITLMLPPTWFTVLLRLPVHLTLYVIPKWTSRESEGPWRLLLLLKVKHLERAQTSQPTPIFPKGKPMGSHMVGS